VSSTRPAALNRPWPWQTTRLHRQLHEDDWAPGSEWPDKFRVPAPDRRTVAHRASRIRARSQSAIAGVTVVASASRADAFAATGCRLPSSAGIGDLAFDGLDVVAFGFTDPFVDVAGDGGFDLVGFGVSVRGGQASAADRDRGAGLLAESFADFVVRDSAGPAPIAVVDKSAGANVRPAVQRDAGATYRPLWERDMLQQPTVGLECADPFEERRPERDCGSWLVTPPIKRGQQYR
jgi:hypothetical protein